jgi:hypothetical protein
MHALSLSLTQDLEDKLSQLQSCAKDIEVRSIMLQRTFIGIQRMYKSSYRRMLTEVSCGSCVYVYSTHTRLFKFKQSRCNESRCCSLIRRCHRCNRTNCMPPVLHLHHASSICPHAVHLLAHYITTLLNLTPYIICTMYTACMHAGLWASV